MSQDVAQKEQLSLFSTVVKNKISANSDYIGAADLELSRKTTRDGYDLDAPARVYSVSKGGTIHNLWVMSTRDAMRVCSHPKSHGKMHGSEWFYCWTQHDVRGEIDRRLKDKIVKDDRILTWEGCEDIRILHKF